MKHLKIVSKGFAGYTGVLGQIRFKDGVSTEAVPQNIADRLAAVTAMVEVDADGGEVPAGIAERLATHAPGRAPVTRAMLRQTEAERIDEERLEALRKEKAPTDKFYSVEELEEIADKGGLKALRAIGDKWGVKDRSIAKLIEQTLKAQSAFLEKRNLRMQMMSDKAAAAALEGKQNADEEAKRLAAEQAAAEAAASTLEPFDGLASAYTAGEKTVPGAVVLERAWSLSSLTLTGFNRLKETERADFVAQALLTLAIELDVEVVTPVVVEDATPAEDEDKQEEPADEPKQDDTPAQDESEGDEASVDGEGTDEAPADEPAADDVSGDE